jgi:hypothetical protein
MKVQCIANTGRGLPQDSLIGSSNEKTTFALVIGKTYVVYAFTVVRNYVWYYLCDEDFTYYPIWNPSPLFKIVDPRLSRYWVFEYTPDGRCESMSGIIIAYPEWASDPWYYDSLSDNCEREVKVFERYRKLIDDEYPDIPTENGSLGT